MKRNLFILLKSIITFVIIIYIFVAIKGEKFLESLSLIKLSTVNGALFIASFQLFLMGVRWHLIQKSFSLTPTFKDSLAYAWTGHFFSLFLPGGIIGGDAVKGWYMKKSGIHLREVSKILFIEKIQILFSLLILCTPFFVSNLSYSYGFLLIMVLLISWISIYLFSRRPYLILITIISLVTNFLACLICYLFVINFNPVITFLSVAKVTPIGLLLGAIPISLGGWGIREGATIYSLSLIGLLPEQSLAIAMATTGIALFVSIPGFFTWLTIRNKERSGCVE